MAIAVEAAVKDPAGARVAALAEQVRTEFDLEEPFIRPHVTFWYGAPPVDTIVLDPVLAAYAQALKGVEVKFDKVGWFKVGEDDYAVYLGMQAVPEALRVIHREIMPLSAAVIPTIGDLCLPEKWVPHVTVAVGVMEDDVLRVAALLREGREPLTFTATFDEVYIKLDDGRTIGRAIDS